jgi:Spy/CpxP family protein refolding chaperone
MKKAISIGLAVVLVAALVTGAMAFGPGYGMGMGKGYGMMVSNLTPEQAQKFAQFQKDVLPLRQKMLQLKTELMTLRTQTTPDWNAIAAKQKEMVDVRTEIQKKATETGITGFGPGLCRGGKGMGMGRMGM